MSKLNIDWTKVGLGTKSDFKIAKELGVSYKAVYTNRRKLKIPGQNKIKYDLDFWKTLPLGQKPDSVIAEEQNISRRVVCSIRNKLNIPAFIGLILTQEGLPCRSIYEAMYDAYLHENKILHEHEVPIENLPYIADFKVGKVYIEIVGMLPYLKYRTKFEKKQKACSDNKIPIVWLEPKDVEVIYYTCSITLLFRENRQCLDCKKETHDIVKGYCRVCYSKHWHRQPLVKNICEECKKEFLSAKEKGYCSYKCYWASNTFNWPTKEELIEKRKHLSIRKIADELGVSYAGLYKHLKRLNLS